MEATNPEHRKQLIAEELERRQQRLIRFFKKKKQQMDAKGVFDSKTNHIRVESRLQAALSNINMEDVENTVDEQIAAAAFRNQTGIFSTEVNTRGEIMQPENTTPPVTSQSSVLGTNSDQKKLPLFRSKSHNEHRNQPKRRKQSSTHIGSQTISSSKPRRPTARKGDFKRDGRQSEPLAPVFHREARDSSGSSTMDRHEPQQPRNGSASVPIADLGVVPDMVPGLHYTFAESMERELESSQGFVASKRPRTLSKFMERKREGNVTRLSDKNWQVSYLFENRRSESQSVNRNHSTPSTPAPLLPLEEQKSYWLDEGAPNMQTGAGGTEPQSVSSVYEEADHDMIYDSDPEIDDVYLRHSDDLKDGKYETYWLKNLIKIYLLDRKRAMIQHISQDLKDRHSVAYGEVPGFSNELFPSDPEPVFLLEQSIVYLCQQFIRRKKVNTAELTDFTSVRIVLVNMLVNMLKYKSTARARRSWTKGAELLFMRDLDLEEVFDSANAYHLLELASYYVSIGSKLSGTGKVVRTNSRCSSPASIKEGMKSVGTGMSAADLWRNIIKEKIIPHLRQRDRTITATEIFTKWVEDNGLLEERDKVPEKVIKIIDAYMRMAFQQTRKAFRYFVSKGKRFVLRVTFHNNLEAQEEEYQSGSSENESTDQCLDTVINATAEDVSSYIDFSSPRSKNFPVMETESQSKNNAFSFNLSRWREEIDLIESVPHKIWTGILNEYKTVANIEMELFELLQLDKYDDFKRKLIAHLRLQRDEFLNQRFFHIAEKHKTEFAANKKKQKSEEIQQKENSNQTEVDYLQQINAKIEPDTKSTRPLESESDHPTFFDPELDHKFIENRTTQLNTSSVSGQGSEIERSKDWERVYESENKKSQRKIFDAQQEGQRNYQNSDTINQDKVESNRNGSIHTSANKDGTRKSKRKTKTPKLKGKRNQVVSTQDNKEMRKQLVRPPSAKVSISIPSDSQTSDTTADITPSITQKPDIKKHIKRLQRDFDASDEGFGHFKNIKISRKAVSFGEDVSHTPRQGLSGNFSKIRERNRQIRESLQKQHQMQDDEDEGEMEILVSKLDSGQNEPVLNSKIYREEFGAIEQKDVVFPSTSRPNQVVENSSSPKSEAPSPDRKKLFPLTKNQYSGDELAKLHSEFIPLHRDEEEIKAIAEEIPPVKLLLELSNLWDKLEIEPSLKARMYNKYQEGIFSHRNTLIKAFVLWTRIYKKLNEREHLLGQLVEFETNASDPRRLLKGSSVKRLEEEKQRTRYLKPLYKLSRQIYILIHRLESEVGDEFYYGDQLYLDKMQRDYSELLYNLEDSRLATAPHLEPGSARTDNSIPMSAANGATFTASPRLPIYEGETRVSIGN